MECDLSPCQHCSNHGLAPKKGIYNFPEEWDLSVHRIYCIRSVVDYWGTFVTLKTSSVHSVHDYGVITLDALLTNLYMYLLSMYDRHCVTAILLVSLVSLSIPSNSWIYMALYNKCTWGFVNKCTLNCC